MSEPPRIFGLHIARTAGTSLADLALGQLGRSNCLLVSSFRQLETNHEQSPQERDFSSLPLFSFGHYVHESLLGLLLNTGPVFAFTMYRDPHERLRSATRHMRSLGVSEEDTQREMSRHPNPTCMEILRCVPLAGQLYSDRPLHGQALAVLSALDLVEPIEQLDFVTARLNEIWRGGANRARHLNASKAYDDALDMSESDVEAFIAEDVELSNRLRSEEWRDDPEELVAEIKLRYADREEALSVFKGHLDRYMAHELRVVKGVESHVAKLRRRALELERMANALEESA
jgi:hypothetical protein